MLKFAVCIMVAAIVYPAKAIIELVSLVASSGRDEDHDHEVIIIRGKRKKRN